ncbi:MAG: S8 family serine peptidase [Ignavibacterium sp.]|jgi:subtilisin family serine protease
MNRVLALAGFLLCLSGPAPSQSVPSRTWIFFSGKPPAVQTSTADLAASLGVSPRALERRGKVLPPERIIDFHDYPVDPAYLQQVKETGAKVISISRWFNAVSVEADEASLTRVASLPFVRGSRPVESLTRPPLEQKPVSPGFGLSKTPQTSIDYGISRTQVANIRVTEVHELGIDGRGVIVGMIDNGFNNHRSHEALRNIEIIDEYDFIHDLPSTQRQPWESASQGNHGATTLSALAGFKEGVLVGPAYRASLLLAKTEMDSTEVPAEEDLYVEALEWMEMRGADIVSTSLGYIDWYTHDSLDGNTAITSKAARIAASKGVLLVTAMGNEGWYQKDSTGKTIQGLTGSLIAPADADSIIAVGATFSDGEIAPFSSTGPTADGRVKPEVVAQGVGVIGASGSSTDGYVSAAGTSMSTPLTAGAAALILSAQRDLTPMQIREALIATAQRISDPFEPSRTATYPNNYYGHGMINARAALTYHGVALSTTPRTLRNDSTLSIFISIVSESPLVSDSLFVMYQTDAGAPFRRRLLIPTATPNLYSVTLPASGDTTYPRGYFVARDVSGSSRTSPYNAPGNLFTFNDYLVVEQPLGFLLHPNYPNPFNAGTIVQFDAPSAVDVEVVVYDILGRTVKVLFRGICSPGPNFLEWKGDNDAGWPVSSGMYIVRLQSPGFVRSGKMLLIR